jgi:hypothetical protein
MGYGLDWRDSFPGRGKRFFSTHRVQTGSGAHATSYPIGKGALSSGVMRPGREADHSPPSVAEVKKSGVIPPLPQ